MVRVLYVLTLVVLLSACALTRSSGPQDIAHVTAWKMWGRVMIHTPDASRSANFYWEQHEQAYHIDLFGPLGLGGVSLVGLPGEAVLTDSHDHRYQANSPEALMQKQLEWSIPVSDLYYWVRGLPVPTAVPEQKLENSFLTINAAQKVNFCLQSRGRTRSLPLDNPPNDLCSGTAAVPNKNSIPEDWAIHYDSYQSLGGLIWPKKMRIETHSVSVVFIIHEVEPL